jgi:hypothetical protein
MSFFSDHVALFHEFLNRRGEIVEQIERTLLNVRGKPLSRSRDRARFHLLLDACFFGLPRLPPPMLSLRGTLAARHLADGFEPVLIDNYAHELDALELIPRAHMFWEARRWPGHSGRVAYAQAIFSVFLLREIGQLSLTIWSDGNALAADRLDEIQRLLDRLAQPVPPGVLIRRAGWLIQAAQGTLTRHLRPYFDIAEHIAESLDQSDRLEVHIAGAKLAGGHLRSQLRYRVWSSGKPANDPELLAYTRNSNSMDMALLVQDLVPLLDAYRTACDHGEREKRLELADAVLQGISADPELLVTRLDLLGPYTGIEALFVDDAGDAPIHYTAIGHRHLQLLERYRRSIGDLAGALIEDASAFAPWHSDFSPYGISYGFCSDLLSNMALDVLASQPSRGVTLEDIFESRGAAAPKRLRADGWANLPKRQGERDHFDHSLEWAAAMFTRLMDGLAARAVRPSAPNASTVADAKLIVTGAPADGGSVTMADAVPASCYCLTSDVDRAMASEAILQPPGQIMLDRDEGRFLASAHAGGKWLGVSKLLLTMLTSRGKDAVLTGLPTAVVERLRLTCPDLLDER